MAATQDNRGLDLVPASEAIRMLGVKQASGRLVPILKKHGLEPAFTSVGRKLVRSLYKRDDVLATRAKLDKQRETERLKKCEPKQMPLVDAQQTDERMRADEVRRRFDSIDAAISAISAKLDNWIRLAQSNAERLDKIEASQKQLLKIWEQ